MQSNTYVDSVAKQLIATVDSMLCELIGRAGEYGDEQQRITAVANECRELMQTPPTILVSGRMKAGKSTLINALVRQKIAETAILECTNAVTVYTKGAPERIENVSLASRGALHSAQSAQSVADLDGRVKVHYLPSQALSQLNFVDTPGLGTVDAANHQIVDGLRELTRVPWNQHGTAIDGLIYVFDSTLRDDEIAHIRSLGFTTLSSVGVLSRADDFGAGAFGPSDPIEAARNRATELSNDYSRYFSSVLAVSGLMAESAETGAITEPLARVLSSLDTVARDTLMHELETDFPNCVSANSRNKLLEVLGSYGVLEGRNSASGGAVQLQRFLRQASGIDSLAGHLGESITFATALSRCSHVQEKLKDLAFACNAAEILDYWEERLTAQQRLAVTIYRLLTQSPGSRVSTEGVSLAEEALQLGTAEDAPRATEIHALASRKLLGLVSPLEEKLLGAVCSFTELIAP